MLVFSRFVLLCSAVVNWARYYIYLSKASLFILGLVFSHGFVKNGVVSILISYITDTWKNVNLPKAAIIVNVQDGVSAIMVIIVAHISDAYIGRFKVTVYCTAAYIIGLVILWLSTNNQIFFLAAVLIAIGKAGRDPPLKAFLADQLTEHRQNMDIYDERVESRTIFWWRVMGFLGATISTIWISKSSWTRIFTISAIVMGVAYLFFWFGINFYHCKKPTGSPVSIIYRVLKAAILNSDQDYPNTAGGYFKNDSGQLLLLPHIPFFRWLDKAAIVESSSLGLEEQEMKSRLCTVTEVKQVKDLLLLVPMWTTIFFYGLVEATESAFFIQQSSNMDNYIGNFEVPINALFLFRSFTRLTIPCLIELLITKWWSEAKQRHATHVRIGVGLFCSILCCITAWQVEVHRLFLIKKYGIVDGDDSSIPMSIFWLAPQYFLLGLMDAFVIEGLRDFFYDHVAESMKLCESSFNDFVLGIGNFLGIPCILVFRSWFGDTINTSHLDKYFLMLAILGFGNLCFYGLVSYKYYACEEAPSEDVEFDSIIVEDGQAHLATESLTTSLISDSRFINWTANGMRSRSIHQHTTTKVLLRRYHTFR